MHLVLTVLMATQGLFACVMDSYDYSKVSTLFQATSIRREAHRSFNWNEGELSPWYLVSARHGYLVNHLPSIERHPLAPWTAQELIPGAVKSYINTLFTHHPPPCFHCTYQRCSRSLKVPGER